MHLTIAWFTNRRDPKFHWFYDSVANQMAEGDEIKILAIDFYTEEQGRPESLMAQCSKGPYRPYVSFHPPMPNVWNGPHRRTKENHFNAAGARNTALCLCADEHIVFADDLAVALPGWLKAAKEAIQRGGITLGCYAKRLNMVVEKGVVISSDEYPLGRDPRLNQLKRLDCSQPGHASWHYGCSLVAPVEAYLKIGGFPEALSAGMGYEDCGAAKMLENNHEKFSIDPRMMTYESEELHHTPGQSFIRSDPCRGDANAIPREDKSHAMLRIVEKIKLHPNHFGQEGIRGLRKRVLQGEPFPIYRIPEHDWYTGQRLEEL